MDRCITVIYSLKSFHHARAENIQPPWLWSMVVAVCGGPSFHTPADRRNEINNVPPPPRGTSKLGPQLWLCFYVGWRGSSFEGKVVHMHALFESATTVAVVPFVQVGEIWLKCWTNLVGGWMGHVVSKNGFELKTMPRCFKVQTRLNEVFANIQLRIIHPRKEWF